VQLTLSIKPSVCGLVARPATMPSLVWQVRTEESVKENEESEAAKARAKLLKTKEVWSGIGPKLSSQ